MHAEATLIRNEYTDGKILENPVERVHVLRCNARFNRSGRNSLRRAKTWLCPDDDAGYRRSNPLADLAQAKAAAIDVALMF